MEEEFGLRVGIVTERAARVGAGPSDLTEALFSPIGIAPGAFVPFKGANGS